MWINDRETSLIEGKRMEVAIDGLIYQRQAHGGISRIYSEILPRMCAMDDTLQVTILTTNRLRQPLPRHPHIKHRRLFPVELILRPGRLWQPVTARIRADLQSWSLGDGRRNIWHSTYYTRPKLWAGAEVVTVVDMIHERYPTLFNRSSDDSFREQKRECVLKADAVICISATTRQDIHGLYDVKLSKAHIIPLAHSPVFRKLNKEELSDGLPTDKPFLLYLGGRSHYKNFAFLLRGYSKWPQRKDVDLVVVGKEWTGAESRFLVELNIAERVHLLTKVADERLVELYNQALAFIFPSLYEGFGIPLLEAMACGCPVVASRIPSTVEVAGEHPLYFEPTEVEALLAALDATLIEGRNSHRVKLGLEYVKQYSWERTAKHTLEVYQHV